MEFPVTHGRTSPRSAARRRHVAAGLALAGPLLAFTLPALAVLTGSRGELLASHWDRVRPVARLVDLLLLGLRFDTAVICAALLPAAILVALLPAAGRLRDGAATVIGAWLAGWLAVLAFNEVATPPFVGEFGVRPNHLYVEYLATPGVVLETVWRTQGGTLLIALGLSAALATACARAVRRSLAAGPAPGVVMRLAWLLVVPLAIGIGARGGLDHRPLSPAVAALTADPLVNDLGLNSTYTAAHALWGLLRDTDLRPYAAVAPGDALAAVEADMQLPPADFENPALSTWHRLRPTGPPGGHPNLVILLQESLGARYFASLGGRPVAQRLEGWRDHSLWFDRMYATGTRSARGIEAIVTGFPPSRAASIIKLPGAERNFFTIARALKAEGYSTVFVYGGDASFDNMRRFFLNNGFDEVIDQHDLGPASHFQTTWGVADEDLYARVDAELRRRTGASGRPVFLLAFSTSNHPPYDFPDGRIALFEQPKNTPANAARYADWAVAGYLDRAAQGPYWDRSVFMLVADHDSRTDGDAAVPVLGSYHIPAFIAGGPVTPRVAARLASQIDLLPTALSVMGIPAMLPATGVDLTRGDLAGPGRALMQFHDNAAYRAGDEVVMLVPGRPPAQYHVSGTELVPTRADPALVNRAEALSAWPALAYGRRLYGRAASGS